MLLIPSFRFQEDFEAELKKARAQAAKAAAESSAANAQQAQPAKAKGFLGRLASNTR